MTQPVENLQQLRVTLATLIEFVASIENHDRVPRPENVHPTIWQAQRDAMCSMAVELGDEASKYIKQVLNG